MSELVAYVGDSKFDDEFYFRISEKKIQDKKLAKHLLKRKCRCCDKKITSQSFEVIKCGFCGESVDQMSCISPYGKWFHTCCLNEFRNFYNRIHDIDAVKHRKDLQIFRDHVLTEMIMRHDLRILKQQWSLLVSNKAYPIYPKIEVISPLQNKTNVGVNQ